MEHRPKRIPARVASALVENLGLKLAALLVAVVLFSAVRGAGTIQRSLDLTLLVAPPPTVIGGPVLLTPLPDKVRLTVRGPASVVGALRPDELGPVQIDLRSGTVETVRLDASRVNLPAGATFAGFTPDSLKLQWDRLAARVLPVRALFAGIPAPGNRLADTPPDVEPARVRVIGPALYVDPLAAVRSEAVDVTGLVQGRHERRVPLEAARAGVTYDVPGGVRVAFEIQPLLVERRFLQVPVSAMGSAAVVLRPPVVDVVLRGAPAVVDPLLASQVVPVVELSELGVLRNPSPARVRVRPLPDGLELVSVGPPEVLVVPAR